MRSDAQTITASKWILMRRRYFGRQRTISNKYRECKSAQGHSQVIELDDYDFSKHTDCVIMVHFV